MYFNPLWSHEHSAFAVTLFVWFWERRRQGRTSTQWMVLGVIGVMLIDGYFPNRIFLVLPAIEVLLAHYSLWKTAAHTSQLKLLSREITLGNAMIGALTPHLYHALFCFWRIVSAWFVYSGIVGLERTPPAGGAFCFGSRCMEPDAHSSAGDSRTGRHTQKCPNAGALCGCAFGSFYYVIACHPYWDGLASLENRVLISLTSVFVFGLALLFERFGRYFHDSGRAAAGLVARSPHGMPASSFTEENT